MKLSSDLAGEKERIEAVAREFGLDFYTTYFELVPWDQLNEVAAYGGFPTRYPHWRHGMIYESLTKSYVYGFSKIYELVINNDPCYAYLMQENDFVSQKLVMAHVYGHCDFFKNNLTFSKTRRNMIDVMANHATRVRRYIDKYGLDKVERFIDACLSIENLMDPYLPFFAPLKREEPVKEDETTHIDIQKLEAKDYMDRFINPPEVMESQRVKAIEHKKKATKFPEKRQKDVLFFLINYAPLRRWQRDLLTIVRDEAYYFAPQGMTKIMNEGWASYWHSTIMTQRAATAAEIVDFADHHAATMATSPRQINPYKLGLELYRDIEERWNKGRHGRQWDECDDIAARARWDSGAMEGRAKLFQVRKLYDDIGFIEEFLTEDFCQRNKLFTFEYNRGAEQYEVASRDFKVVKEKLLSSLTNMGHPFIYVEDGNYKNRGELLLGHEHTGVDLDQRYLRETLRNVQMIWNRPVNLATRLNNQSIIYAFDGSDFSERGG